MAPKKKKKGKKAVIWMRINEHPRLEITSSKSLFEQFAIEKHEAPSSVTILVHPQDEKVWGKSRTSSHDGFLHACARERMVSAAWALQL